MAGEAKTDRSPKPMPDAKKIDLSPKPTPMPSYLPPPPPPPPKKWPQCCHGPTCPVDKHCS
jgi:hypothetical protein